MQGNTVAIHSVLKKKTMKLNSQPTQYIKNKIDKDNLKKKTCGEILQQNKNHTGKLCNNPQC